MKTTESQVKAILKALKRGRKLTAMHGLNEFKAMQYNARIFDIKALGYKVERKLIKVGYSKKQVAEHFIAPKNRRLGK